MDLTKHLKTHFAKSDGKTTIEKHIQDLLEQFSLFVQQYPSVLTNKEKELLKVAIKYHDYGKLNKLFQCKLPISKALKPVNCECSKHRKRKGDKVPHQFLSPLFMRDLGNRFSKEDLTIVVYSVVNHHARGRDEYLSDKYGIYNLLECIESNIAEFFGHLFEGKELRLSEETREFYEGILEDIIDEIANVSILNKKFENEKDVSFLKTLIKVAGLLIRVDHAASGEELVVEEEPIVGNREGIFKDYLKAKKEYKEPRLRPFQEKFKDYDNLVLVADTGLGKTGLAVLWAKRKMFYVLPNRASTNAMYDTLGQIFGKNRVGLLHSTSLLYLLEGAKKEDYTVLRDYDNTKNLAKPVTVSTADQLFTAVFKYPTYEKIYATLSYSDVVIDEIQGFDPAQIVPILSQVKETVKLGARYLIITATLPEIVRQEFEKLGFTVKVDAPETIDATKRHKVAFYELEINSVLEEIVAQAKSGKNVLVIVNTVTTAQEVYKELKEKYLREKVKLLHSRFIWEHRSKRETEIKIDGDSTGKHPKEKGVIWVTTQLVEVSLNIDFDVLFTEAATADSLIQRMGRVWRHRQEDYKGKPNVYICKKVDEGRNTLIYEKVLREKSIELIREHLDVDGYLLSMAKRKIVETLYSRELLKSLGAKYLSKWDEVERIFNSGWNYLLKSEAQHLFRDTITFEAIPRECKDKVKKLLDELREVSSIEDKRERRLKRVDILKNINNFKVPVPLYWVLDDKGRLILNEEVCELLDFNLNLYVLGKCFKYSEELGLEPNREELKKFKKNYNDALFA
ncbi:MAG: CRISPR-associated helicase Cas3' [Aquificae bacterium]|nr:CRISPR-associated helicase Cas3' [Aquificota bacterium]